MILFVVIGGVAGEPWSSRGFSLPANISILVSFLATGAEAKREVTDKSDKRKYEKYQNHGHNII